jgi:hypothetical protein
MKGLMWSLLKIYFLFVVAIFFARGLFAATFTDSLDRDTITLGESATLSLTFEGGQAKNVPTPRVDGLQITQNGTSQSMSFVNGAMSSTFTVNFSVSAQRAGEFTIPALTADVNGQQLSTVPIKLVVLKADAPSTAVINSGDEVAFMKLLLPQKKIYTGQPVVAQLQLYVRDDVSGLNGFQLTSSSAEGFNLGKMVEGQRGQTQIGNHNYTIVPLLMPVTAMKSGVLTLGPFSASAVIVLPSQDRSGDPFFRQFFNQGQQKQISLATEQLSIESESLPQKNVPPDFNGAIGDFTLNVSAGPTNLTVGDPITVRVQISGRGALDAIQFPAENWRDFKTFAPTQKTETSDQFGLQGTKTFEQIVSPQNSDVRELPEFSFSFFNPDDGNYHTLTQPALPLVVHSAGATPMPTIAANKNSAPENQTPPDILPLKENLGMLTEIPAGQNSLEPLISKPIFLAAQTLPVLAFLAALVWRKRADSLANNPRLRRRIAVEKLIQTGIADLRKFAAENNSDEFFALLFRLLQEQLGERLDCPATAITENVVEENSLLRRVPDAARNDLRELFQLCNQARYAPVRGTSELNSVAAQFEKTVGELQNLRT